METRVALIGIIVEQPDSVAQTAGNECAVRLRQAEFPR